MFSTLSYFVKKHTSDATEMALQTRERGFDELHLCDMIPLQRLLGIVASSDMTIKDTLSSTIALNGGR